MNTTVGEIIDQVRQLAYGSYRSEFNQLAVPLAAADTTVQFAYDLKGIVGGSLFAVDGELIYVWNVNGQAKTANIMRGYQGSDIGDHASGAVVEVSPRFPRSQIIDVLQEEIRSWGPDLFRVSSVILSTSPAVRGYDLTGTDPASGAAKTVPPDFYFLVDVRRSPLVVTGMSTSNTWPRVPFEVRRNLPTTVAGDGFFFTSGSAIFLKKTMATVQGMSSSLPTLSVQYAYPFDTTTQWAETTDLIADVGLATTMLDLAKYGAAWRLMSTREILRTETGSQGEEVMAQQVPPGSITNVSKGLEAIRDDRYRREVIRLLAEYPSRNSG